MRKEVNYIHKQFILRRNQHMNREALLPRSPYGARYAAAAWPQGSSLLIEGYDYSPN